MSNTISALILAAGKGTRMISSRPKVLQTILGEPMLLYVYRALEPLFGRNINTVVGFGAEQVEAAFPDRAGTFVLQEEQLGTGHALQVAWDKIVAGGAEYCMVINGDTPLVTAEAVEKLTSRAGKADLAFMSINPPDPGAFGRVVRGDGQHVRAIVEAKDYDLAVHGPVTGEVNAGIYLLRLSTVGPLLDGLRAENKSGEYYITDLVGLAVENGLKVEGVSSGADVNLMGINNPSELIAAEQALRKRIVEGFIDQGVMIHNPDTVIIGPRVSIEPGVEVFGHVEIYGESSIKSEAALNSYTYIIDAVFDSKCVVRQFCHIEGAHVGPECVVGPYARLRQGAVLKRGSRVGNFVEMKKSELGEGAKANHLTYLGDAEVGAGSNIGAGTITCNYDGRNKFKTTIGEGAFIGSNTALVAPVTVGKDALVAAGSTITKNIPDEWTAIARGKQSNLDRKMKKS